MGLDFGFNFKGINDQGINQILNIPASSFHTLSPDIDDVVYTTDLNRITASAAVTDNTIIAPIILPDGATITSFIVYGSDATNVYILLRQSIRTGGGGYGLTDGNDKQNTYAVLEKNTVIDNENWAYFIQAEIGNGDSVYGAVLRYRF